MKNYHGKTKLYMCLHMLWMCLVLTACQSSVSESTESTPDGNTKNLTIEPPEITESTEPEIEETVNAREEEKTNDTVYTKPPVMTIKYGNQTLSIPAFSYEWHYQVSEEEDTWSGGVADAAHPLDQNFSDRILYLNPANSVHEVSMEFDITPASIEVLTYWPAPVGADALPHQSMPAPKEEIDYDSGIRYDNTADIIDPNVFLAFEGQYIYEIYAAFEAEKYHGGAYYTVLIKDDSDSVTASEVEE